MRAVLFFSLIFFSLSRDSVAQNAAQIRRLPPSLERELKLRKGGKIRIIGFTDTLKAQSLIAQSIRDSSSEELDSLSVKDSAIIVIDSSVSSTDKEWLDSMLAELPEYRMTPEGIRFHYPADILVETSRKTVPPDTTLASRMDPVSKEDLPLYDALPMPRPLQRTSFPKTSAELGVGVPYLPRIDINSRIVSNEKTSLYLNGKYRLTGSAEPAIKQFWQIGAQGNFAFPNASPSGAEQIPQLNIDAATGANKRRVISQIDSTSHSLSQTNFDADFVIGTPSQLKMRTHAFVSLLNDDIGSGNSENQAGVNIFLQKDITNSSFRLQFDAQYQGASSISNVRSSSPNYFETKILLQQKENDPIRWSAGVSYLGGSDAGGSTSKFFPVATIRTRLSHSIEIGASFEPKPFLFGLRELLGENLFYSPAIVEISLSKDSLFRTDARRVVSEPIHLRAFINYFLSLDNELLGEFRFIKRNNEPVFNEHTDIQGHTIFDVIPMNTQRIELEAGGRIVLFVKDKLRASVLFRSPSNRENAQALQFVPTTQIQAVYQFGNISEKLIPQIEFINLSRVNHSFSFINIDAKYIFTPQFQLKFRAENILGSAGDFWTGYDEYPRSAWISAQYSF